MNGQEGNHSKFYKYDFSSCSRYCEVSLRKFVEADSVPNSRCKVTYGGVIFSWCNFLSTLHLLHSPEIFDLKKSTRISPWTRGPRLVFFQKLYNLFPFLQFLIVCSHQKRIFELFEHFKYEVIIGRNIAFKKFKVIISYVFMQMKSFLVIFKAKIILFVKL
jgi:hypothetical protein